MPTAWSCCRRSTAREIRSPPRLCISLGSGCWRFRWLIGWRFVCRCSRRGRFGRLWLRRGRSPGRARFYSGEDGGSGRRSDSGMAVAGKTRGTVPAPDGAGGPPARQPTDCRRYWLARSGEDQGDVVRLFVIADPVIDRHGYDLTDLGQRQVPVLADQVDQALLAEFAEIIFWFGDAIAVGQEDFARMHFDRAFFVGHVIE